MPETKGETDNSRASLGLALVIVGAKTRVPKGTKENDEPGSVRLQNPENRKRTPAGTSDPSRLKGKGGERTPLFILGSPVSILLLLPTGERIFHAGQPGGQEGLSPGHLPILFSHPVADRWKRGERKKGFLGCFSSSSSSSSRQ